VQELRVGGSVPPRGVESGEPVSPVALSDAQRAAVSAHHHVVVEAGAGSGKTRVLVERYLKLLRDDPSRRPGDLLAITFTNRAAAEMRRRLRERLAEMAQDDPGPATRGQAQSCLEDFHLAAVTTIHAFATSILRRHPFEAGIDPEFTVADEIETEHARGDIVERLLQEIDAAPGEHGLRPAALAPLRAWGHRRTVEALSAMLTRERIDAAQWDHLAARSPQEALAEAERLWAAWASECIDCALGAPETRSLIERGAAALAGVSEDPEIPVTVWPRVATTLLTRDPRFSIPDSRSPIPTVERAAAFERLCGLTLTAAGEPRKKPPTPYSSLPKKAVASLQEIVPALGAALAPLREEWVPWRAAHEREAADLSVALAQLASRASRALAERKDADGWLDFADQLRGAARLVEAEPERVAAALAGQFHGILIDEFQDTDPDQWRLVRALLSAARNRLPVMLVGDPRQSIYRFRGAEVRLFSEARDDLAQQSVPEDFALAPLRGNYRSAPSLIHAINGIFAHLLPRVTSGTSAPMEAPALEPANAQEGSWPAGLHLLAVPSGKDLPDALTEEAEAIAALIGGMVRNPTALSRSPIPDPRFPSRFSDFAILLRATTHLDAFENALRAAGVPFHVGGGAGLAERQEINDLAHLLRFLSEPGDDQALLGLLRTPWMGWSDDLLMKVTLLTCGLETRSPAPLWDRVLRVRSRERHGVSLGHAEWERVESARAMLTRALARCHVATPAEAATDVLTATGAWALVRLEPEGRRRLANLRRGLERLRQERERGFESVLAAAESLRRLVAQGGREGEEQLIAPGEDAVAVMTIHAAKGLEFPVVILPQLHRRQNVHEKRGDWAWDAEFGLGVRAPNPEDRWRPERSAVMQMAGVRESREAEAEEARLLYVAMTRAQQMLIASGAVRGPLNEAAEAAERNSSLAQILDAIEITPGDLASSALTPRWPHASPIPVLSPEMCRALAPTAVEEGPRSVSFAVTRETLDRITPLPTLGDPERPVAITALATFARCPNLLFLERELGALDRGWFRRDASPLPPSRGKGMGDGGSPPDAAAVGGLFHRWVEKHLIDPSAEPAAVAEEFFRERGELVDSAVVDRVATLWRNFTDSEIASRLAHRDEAFAEHEILVAHPEGPLRGRIDLLVRWSETWEVIDFKTPAQGGDDGALAARHRVQMLCYLLFLAAHAPLQRELTARLVFPALGRELPVTIAREEIPKILAEIGDLIRRFKLEAGRLHRVERVCAECRHPRLCMAGRNR
jgi:ATP-dependent helicase/nuclease subunit A